ncbi:MAG TPA: universal stress protein [Pseudonocardiaceae bacterium]|nr:universal stress protein [Pseudonocardiaceae bacterium]
MGANDAVPPIVVGVDGSRFGREALRWALAEASRRDCDVRALLVANVPSGAVTGRPDVKEIDTLSAKPGQEQLRLLEETVGAVLDGRDDPRLTAEVVRGSASDMLCAASIGAQPLVLGSHGHGSVFEALAGSVARYCVHHADCPVVVIPAGLSEQAETVPRETAGPAPLSYGIGPLL